MGFLADLANCAIDAMAQDSSAFAQDLNTMQINNNIREQNEALRQQMEAEATLNRVTAPSYLFVGGR